MSLQRTSKKEESRYHAKVKYAVNSSLSWNDPGSRW